MRTSTYLIASLIISLMGCGDDGEPIAASGGPKYGGSCNFLATSSCTEYAEAMADANTAGACTSSGGQWSAAQCPLMMRTGVCVGMAPATRTYAYTEVSATAMQATCVAPAKFNAIMSTDGYGGMGGRGGTGGTVGGCAGSSGGAGGDAGAGGLDEDAGI